MIRLLATLLIGFGICRAAGALDLSAFEAFSVPVGAGAREPFLVSTRDGRLLMSWTEPSGDGFAVKVAFMDNGNWSAPGTVVSSPDLFVNWADFPSVAAFANGALVAHWLQISGSSPYSYDVNLSFSHDQGRSWSLPIVPHHDGTESQHGFVTLHPLDNEVIAIWLDGRAYDGDLVEEGASAGTMQLRSALVSPDGSVTPDVALDFMTCSCCQTAAALSGDELLVVYRDRTEAEVRDISITGLRRSGWTAPRPVHQDNWEISGCPINGPSIAARDDQVVVAWFTGAGGLPAVKIAFSSDGGFRFSDAFRIDQGQPVGRVDALMLDDGSAVISWVEWAGSDEVLYVCHATADGCVQARSVAVNSGGNSINFPQLAATPEGIYVAWTHPLSDGTDTIRMLRTAR